MGIIETCEIPLDFSTNKPFLVFLSRSPCTMCVWFLVILDPFPFLYPCPVAFFSAIHAAVSTAPNAAAYTTAGAAAAINAGIAAN